MFYEKSTDRAWHVMGDETNMEYLGSVRLHDDGYWRFKPVDREFTVRELNEITRKISDVNINGHWR